MDMSQRKDIKEVVSVVVKNMGPGVRLPESTYPFYCLLALCHGQTT